MRGLVRGLGGGELGRQVSSTVIVITLVIDVSNIIKTISKVVIDGHCGCTLGGCNFSRKSVNGVVVAFTSAEDCLHTTVKCRSRGLIGDYTRGCRGGGRSYRRCAGRMGGAISSTSRGGVCGDVARGLGSCFSAYSTMLRGKGGARSVSTHRRTRRVTRSRITPVCRRVCRSVIGLVSTGAGRKSGLRGVLAVMRLVALVTVVTIVTLTVFTTHQVNEILTRGVISPLSRLNTHFSAFTGKSLSDRFPRVASRSRVSRVMVITHRVTGGLTTIVRSIGRHVSLVTRGSCANISGVPRGCVNRFTTVGSTVRIVGASVGRAVRQVRRTTSRMSTNSAGLTRKSRALTRKSASRTNTIRRLLTSFTGVARKIRRARRDTRTSCRLSMGCTRRTSGARGRVGTIARTVGEVDRVSGRVRAVVKRVRRVTRRAGLLTLGTSVRTTHTKRTNGNFTMITSRVKGLTSRDTRSTIGAHRLVVGSVRRVRGNGRTISIASRAVVSLMRKVGRITGGSRRLTRLSRARTRRVGRTRSNMGRVSRIMRDGTTVTRRSSTADRRLSTRSSSLGSLIRRFGLG